MRPKCEPTSSTLTFTALPLRAAETPVLLVLGDSISAGYGLAAGEGWVNLLMAKLKADGYDYRIVNASISGDTTAGGRARLPALLKKVLALSDLSR